MPSRRLSVRTALDVQMSAVMTRNMRTDDPQPVVAELLALAAEDQQLIAEAAGVFVGYYRDGYSDPLCAAVEAQIDGLGPWIELGRERRARSVHGGPEQKRLTRGRSGRRHMRERKLGVRGSLCGRVHWLALGVRRPHNYTRRGCSLRCSDLSSGQ